MLLISSEKKFSMIIRSKLIFYIKRSAKELLNNRHTTGSTLHVCYLISRQGWMYNIKK